MVNLFMLEQISRSAVLSWKAQAQEVMKYGGEQRSESPIFLSRERRGRALAFFLLRQVISHTA
jgi:hypothetical protein